VDNAKEKKMLAETVLTRKDKKLYEMIRRKESDKN